MNWRPYRPLLNRLPVGIICSVFLMLFAVSSHSGVVTASAYVTEAATPTISTSPTASTVVSATPTPIAPISVKATTPPDYQLANLILMGIYVFFTLVVAIGALWSVFITRAALNASKEQSHEALVASEKQSKAAIDAVKQQIEASEKQSVATIEAVNRQIDASERQAKEAMHNQHRPVLVPGLGLQNIIDSTGGWHITWERQNQVIDGLKNVGVGPAFNIYGIMFGKPISSLPPRPRYIVWNYPSLSPGREGDKITLQPGSNIPSDTKIQGYTLYVPDEPGYNGVIARFTLTYHDVFGRKYASIYDYQHVIGWMSRGHFSDIEHDIYELDQQTPGTQQTNQFFFDAGKRAQPG